MGKRATPGAPRKKSALLGRSSFRSFSWGFFSPCVFDGSEQNRKFFRHILKSEPPGATRKKSAPRGALFLVHFGGDFVAHISGRSLFRSFSWCFCYGNGFFRPRNKERPWKMWPPEKERPLKERPPEEERPMGALRVAGKRAPPRGAHISVHFHGGTGFFLPGAPMGRSFSHIRYRYYWIAEWIKLLGCDCLQSV